MLLCVGGGLRVVVGLVQKRCQGLLAGGTDVRTRPAAPPSSEPGDDGRLHQGDIRNLRKVLARTQPRERMLHRAGPPASRPCSQRYIDIYLYRSCDREGRRMARQRIITLLMPLPTYYNPDPQGVRKPIEKWKFTRTAEEISEHFDAGAELQGLPARQAPWLLVGPGTAGEGRPGVHIGGPPRHGGDPRVGQVVREHQAHRPIPAGRDLPQVAFRRDRARATRGTGDPNRGGMRCREGS